MAKSKFKHLEPSHIVDSALKLQSRIAERFSTSSLASVSGELVQVTKEAQGLSNWLASPILAVRWSIGIVLASLAALVCFALAQANFDMGNSFSAVAGSIESLVNDLIFVGFAAYFLLGLERRIKRNRAQKALHVLRSMAHVVDMHQLTKDPDSLNRPKDQNTKSSPKRSMTAFQLARYFNYCSEMLALMSKVAVLYVQDFDDAETLEIAGDIEELTLGLSRNIWQKIMILDRITDQR